MRWMETTVCSMWHDFFPLISNPWHTQSAMRRSIAWCTMRKERRRVDGRKSLFKIKFHLFYIFPWVRPPKENKNKIINFSETMACVGISMLNAYVCWECVVCRCVCDVDVYGVYVCMWGQIRQGGRRAPFAFGSVPNAASTDCTPPLCPPPEPNCGMCSEQRTFTQSSVDTPFFEDKFQWKAIGNFLVVTHTNVLPKMSNRSH